MKVSKKIGSLFAIKIFSFFLLILANRNFNRKFHNRKLLNRRSIKKIFVLVSVNSEHLWAHRKCCKFFDH